MFIFYLTCQVYIRPHNENVGPAGVNSVGFSSLIWAVDLLKNSKIHSFFFSYQLSFNFHLLLGPLEASPLTTQVKIKDSKAMNIEAITPPSCVYIDAVSLPNE